MTPAWSPIGGITFYRDSKHTSTLVDPVILDVANAHAKSPAQVMLRWHLQEGRSVIPKSTKPELHLEICSNCHPFFTGRQKLIDTEGRVERFTKKYGAQTSESRKKAAADKAKKEAPAAAR